MIWLVILIILTYHAQDWLDEFFKKDERDQIVLFKTDNVLTPKALNEVIWYNVTIVL